MSNPWSARLRPLCALLAALLAAGLASAQTDFVAFESGQVRPARAVAGRDAACSRSTPPTTGSRSSTSSGGASPSSTRSRSGMEPVAVAARSNTEVWVVNHLSDSVSIVDLAATPPRVARTLLVGDEPRDIVFAGTGGNRAFITTAHRGQQRTRPLDRGRDRRGRSAAHHRRASAAPTSGSSTRPSSARTSAARRCAS